MVDSRIGKFLAVLFVAGGVLVVTIGILKQTSGSGNPYLDSRVVSKDVRDSMGRTVVYDQVEGSDFNGWGNPNSKWLIIGRVKGMLETADGDAYIEVNVQGAKTPAKYRLVYKDDYSATDMWVENLLKVQNRNLALESVGVFSVLGKKLVRSVVTSGDIVVLIIRPKDGYLGEGEWQAKTDEMSVPLVSRIIVRRFNGKDGLNI